MGRRHYVGIFLLSLAMLLLELSLTRVLSVALWYHFGFLVISTALLGFGASGVTLSLWVGLRERAPIDRTLATLCVAFGLTTIASFWVMQRIPFDPFGQLANWHQIVYMPLYYLALAAPFFCCGLVIALLFTRGAQVVNKLYAADLLGAGTGCAALAVVMPIFGGSGTVVVASALGFLAAVVFGGNGARRLGVASGGLAIAALGLALVGDQVLPISIAANKEHPLLPKAPRPAPLLTEWNATSRIDVYALPPMPQEGWPDSGVGIVIDGGTAATGMGDLSKGVKNFLSQSLEFKPLGLAYVGKTHPKVLILGSGAGREVLEALYFGASSITAVEINPIINAIVTRRMRAFFGGLFEQPEVHLVTDEGRSFIRRSNEKYDTIISIQTISNAAVASGALGLAEDYMYTREAMEEYIDHLTSDGILLITRPRSQIPRLFATACEVFKHRGLGSPANHLVALRSPLMPWGPRQVHSVFLLKKSPWKLDELQSISERIGSSDSESDAEDASGILYSPTDPRPGSIYHQLVTAPDLQAIYSAQSYVISPATDNRPFFNQQRRWSNLWLGSWIQSGMSPGVESTLIILLVQSTIIAGALILLPLARFSRRGLLTPGRWAFLVYFAGLGLGFIMIEIALLQRFTLFLGQPVYTFAVVLASLLVFTGAGSFLSGRVGDRPRRGISLIVPAILVVLVLTALVAPAILSAALGLQLPWRVTLAVLLLAPLGVLLGIPFPTGLRLVANEAPSLMPWAWGVNGFFTVIGSVGAMMLGMMFGFRVVLLVAGACYVASLLAITGGKRQ